jgi:hypothetical protein
MPLTTPLATPFSRARAGVVLGTLTRVWLFYVQSSRRRAGVFLKQGKACQCRRRATSVATEAPATQCTGACVSAQPATSPSIVANEGRVADGEAQRPQGAKACGKVGAGPGSFSLAEACPGAPSMR